MGCTLPATNKSTPTCLGRDAAKTSCYRAFHEDAPAENAAAFNGVGVFMAGRRRTTALFPSIFSVNRMTYQGGSYEFDEIVTAHGQHQCGGNGAVVVRLRFLSGLPPGDG